MTPISDAAVREVFESYPLPITKQLLVLRQLVFDVAEKIEGEHDLVETLKWGEPSYLMKGGSTLRMAWKPATSEQYALYFNCKTRLIETFKEIYGEQFHYQGNRATVFTLGQKIPQIPLKQCIAMSLRYHRVKHLPLLGA